MHFCQEKCNVSIQMWYICGTSHQRVLDAALSITDSVDFRLLGLGGVYQISPLY